jgi:hypothetical protein
MGVEVKKRSQDVDEFGEVKKNISRFDGCWDHVKDYAQN